MTEISNPIKRIEAALERAEREGCDLETLSAIQLEVEGMSRVCQTAEGPIRFELFESLLQQAAQLCRTNRSDVLVMDVEKARGGMPSLRELRLDPEMARVWDFFAEKPDLHPVLIERAPSLGGVEFRRGELWMGDAREWAGTDHPALIVKPGRPTREQYESYPMSRVTSWFVYEYYLLEAKKF